MSSPHLRELLARFVLLVRRALGLMDRLFRNLSLAHGYKCGVKKGFCEYCLPRIKARADSVHEKLKNRFLQSIVYPHTPVVPEKRCHRLAFFTIPPCANFIGSRSLSMLSFTFCGTLSDSRATSLSLERDGGQRGKGREA